MWKEDFGSIKKGGLVMRISKKAKKELEKNKNKSEKMRNKIFFLIFLLMISSVMAKEQTVIKTYINLSFDNNNSILRIVGENLNWAKTINICTVNCTSNSSWIENLEILMVREMGNLSDVTNLFEKLDVCINQMNYTDEYVRCMSIARDKDNQLLDCKEGVSYKQNYTECQDIIAQKDNAIRDKDDEKDVAIRKVQDDMDKIRRQRDWLTIASVIGGIISAIFLYKNKGGLFAKKEERSQLPTRFSV